MRKRYSALFLAVSLLSAVASAALFAAGSKGKQQVYALTVPDAAAPRAQDIIRGARLEADKLGAELLVLDPRRDALRQLDQLGSSLERGVDGLIVGGSVDPAALLPAIRGFNERGIPVMALEPLSEGGQAYLIAGQPAADAGLLAVRYLWALDHGRPIPRAGSGR